MGTHSLARAGGGVGGKRRHLSLAKTGEQGSAFLLCRHLRLFLQSFFQLRRRRRRRLLRRRRRHFLRPITFAQHSILGLAFCLTLTPFVSIVFTARPIVRHNLGREDRSIHPARRNATIVPTYIPLRVLSTSLFLLNI